MQRGFPGDDDNLDAQRQSLQLPLGGNRGFPDADPDPLGQVYGEALKQQPDQSARVWNLRVKTGLPPALIERNLDAIEREAAVEGFDAARFRQQSPLLAKWLEENPELAAIAADDLQPLSGLERTLQVGARAARALTTGPMTISSGAWGAVRAGAEWSGADDLAEFARGSAAVADHLRTRLRGDRAGAGGFESSVYGGLESLSLTATALPAALLGGAPALLAVLGGVTGGEAYTQAREEGAGLTRATGFAFGPGAIEAATELLPARWFLADLAKNAGFWRALKHQAFSEIPGEQIATALQDLNEWALVQKDGTFLDYLRERPSAAGQTLVATIVAVGGQAALVRGLERLDGKPASQQVLEQLHETAAESKTRERSPEALRALVDRLTSEGLTHVYAPAAAFTEYFQKQGEDPEQLSIELTGNPDALRLAAATNGDLAIPTSAYVSRIVGSGHESFFANELRLSPDAMNARETQEAIAAEASATFDDPPADPSAAGREQVFQTMVEKLTATNRYTPQEVDAQARLYASVFGALGSRAGVTPDALFEQFQPAVVAEGRPSDTSIEIDTGGSSPGGVPTSEARAGESPAQREVRRAGHLEALASVLTRQAQLLDPDVDPAVIKAELDRRLEMSEEQQALKREGGVGQDLLRAIAGYGGVRWTGVVKGGEFAIHAREATDKRERRGGVRASGGVTWNGVAGVFNDQEGLTPDDMVTSLRQDQRFEYIEDIDALLAAVEDALVADPDVDALPGTDELAALGIQPGTRWWTDESAAGEEQLYGRLQQPAPPPNDGGQTAYFIGWQEGFEDIEAIALYNVIGGPTSGTTLSPVELDEQGIPYFPAPELAGAEAVGDVEFNTAEFEQAELDEDALDAWAADVKARYGADLTHFDVELIGEDIVLSLLVVDGGARSSGIGSDVMRELTALADKHGRRIALLLAKPSDGWGTSSRARLRKFYERFGFTLHELEEDPDLPADMVRKPQPPTDTEFEQSAPRDARRAWLERRIVEARKKGKEDLEANRLLQDLLDEEADEVVATRERGTEFRQDALPPGVRLPAEVQPIAGDVVSISYPKPRVVEPSEPAQADPTVAEVDELARAIGVRLAQLPQGTRPTEFRQDDPPPGWRSIEAGPEPKNVPPGRQTKGTFNPSTRTIRLFKTADRSTFIHESAHLFLEVMSDLAAAPGANEQLQADMATLLSSFQFEGDLASWRALTHEQRRDHHEEFARGFERYLGEGKAPVPELQALFARFRAWLLGVYRTLRRLQVELSPEVRAVFDRMLATDEAIAAAEADAGVVALFTDAAAAGVSESEFEAYRDQLQAASDQARARLQARLLRELEREQEAWWREQREAVREEVAAEIYERPVYRAIAAMRGTQPNGDPLPEGTPATPLSKDFLVAQFGRSILRKLPRPYVYSAESGLPPDTVAQIFGYRDGEALIGAVLSAPPMDDAIDQITDERMLERHGDLLRDPDALVEQAREAIAGEHRDQVVRAELAMLRKLRGAGEARAKAATTEQRAEQRAGERVGAERLRTEMPDDATLARLAKNQIGRMRLRDIRPERLFAAARRHSRNATTWAAQGKFEDAVGAKQQELVNLALYREAVAAREAVDAAREEFAGMFKPDGPLAKRRNMDYVQAARAIAATYFWPERRLASAVEALELVRKHDPDLHEVLSEQVRAARSAGDDLGALTFEAFSTMRDAVQALWEQSLREQQMLVDGQLVDRNEAVAALVHRLDELGTPESQAPQTERGMFLLGMRAALRRVESWVDYVDGGDPSGAFRRYIWNPIAEATAQYRIQKAEYLQKYLELVKSIEKTLLPGRVAAPELGYEFESKAALLHALLHTGNESNFQKLLRGRKWGDYLDDGTVDASRWAAFLQRAHREGVITKADWDFVQSAWDLLAEVKPAAQKVHREMYGHYFSELTTWPVETPFGTYRGGYVPAVVDPLQAADAATRSERESLSDGDNAFMFPTTGRGFTKQRAEGYAKPLALDLRLLPGHLDKVLRFIHIEPRVKDAGRLLWNHGFQERLAAYDPTARGDMLVPWLQRAASQRIARANAGWAGRAMDQFFRALRSRSGINLMAGNVINTLQQFTGILPALTKVEPRYLRSALWRYTRDHKRVIAEVAEASEFMRTRTTSQVMEVQRTIDDLLLNPSKYERLREFGNKHGYLLQTTTQNIVDTLVWSGAYEKATEGGATQRDAVRQADAAVRETQGSFAPEDASRLEMQTPFVRAFVMFYGYFNTMANLNGSELAKVARDIGLRKGAGRALYIYTFGFMAPAIIAEVIRQALGGWDDDDDETHVDEALWLFFGAQSRMATAMLPGVGPAALTAVNFFNDKPYDDRISTSPAITTLESALRAPYSVYQTITEDRPAKRAVRDTLSALALLTGLPVGAIARPAGYLTDVLEGEEMPEDLPELARGVVSGRSQQAYR